MSTSTPDAIVQLRLLSPEEGGRCRPISRYEGSDYGCLIWLDAEYFDCRWLLADGQILALGAAHLVAIRFADRSLVDPLLIAGKRIKMWEGKVIAEGSLAEIFKCS